MFGLFKKKETGPTIVNKVWVSKQQKWNGCLQLLKEKPATQFVVWFDETFTELNAFLEQHNHSLKVIMYRQALSSNAANYVFAEHYPLAIKEKELFAQLNMNLVLILSGLDEPLFKHFGSDKTVELLSKLGLKDDEVLEHSYITSSIARAQERLAEHVLLDNSSRSQKEWMERNVK